MDINSLFKSVVAWAQNDQRIHAVVLVGSHARGNSRPDSDVDLCILMDRQEELLKSPSFFSRFGAMKRYELEDWTACQSVRVWYQNELEVEFGLVKPDWIKRPLDPGTMRVLQSGCKVLVDKHGLFAGLDLSSAKEITLLDSISSNRRLSMEKMLIKRFHELGIEELKQVTELHKLKGDFINLECTLPNGQIAKVLDDDKIYYGAEVCKRNSDRCYGLAADCRQMLVYEYGNGGADAELIIWKRISD